MKFSAININGPKIIHLSPFEDDRGLFVKFFCEETFAPILADKRIVQINHSLSKHKGTIRGMHFQKPPFAETKIIRCIKGKAFDVLVDIRMHSKTFLSWYGIELTASNNLMIFIPEGFAHGFQALEDNTELIYLHTAAYQPQFEAGLRFDDPAININWKLPPQYLSNRDNNFKFLNSNFKGVEL